MPKSNISKGKTKAKNIKNVYINKINSLFKVTGDINI